MSRQSLLIFAMLSLIAVVMWNCATPARAAQVELLNVSYDPTRELWRAINEAFVVKYKAETGTGLTIKMSHGGSGSQARAVIDGLQADVVTLAIWPDTDAIRKAGLLGSGWEKRLPNNSVAYHSTIVFVVRKGNPKGIKDWPDLAHEGIEVVTPNPKTSGNGKLSFLAAWGSVITRGGTEQQARELVTQIYRRVPVLDTGARGATTTFAQKRIGDVHLTWENEAHLELAEFPGQLEIVYPPVSFLAEPPLAWVDANVGRKGTRAVAEAYLRFLFTTEAQEIIARHFYRPVDPEVRARHRNTFPDIQLFPITAVAESWEEAYRRFFSDGGLFDTIYAEGRK
ncbi:MAG: sulfate ABC transporter, periplasmic protein [Candidatus Binatia bacterium]|nr:MAG: sulfate ABC transporter, periplasmic protein [Candidatus Binatia bacterium]